MSAIPVTRRDPPAPRPPGSARNLDEAVFLFYARRRAVQRSIAELRDVALVPTTDSNPRKDPAL